MINTGGLLLDIVGVVLLFRFGLPPDVSRDGAVVWTLGTDEGEVRKAKRFVWVSWAALGLIVTGFILQIVSTWMR
ncbi:MAG: hypothetical protein F4Y73_14705 [Gemmatimonadetes bacterium]|nr:hypothetical protein [Gemmatimonadota bacterium]